MTSGQGPDGHDLGVGHQLASQASGQVAVDLGVVLGVALAAVATDEAALVPDQGGSPAVGDVTDGHPPRLMYPIGEVATVSATAQRADVNDRHLQPVWLVDEHLNHPHPPQVQPDGHSVSSHGAPPPRLW